MDYQQWEKEKWKPLVTLFKVFGFAMIAIGLAYLVWWAYIASIMIPSISAK